MRQKDAHVFLGISESLEKLNQSSIWQYGEDIDEDGFESWFEESFNIPYYNELFRIIDYFNSATELRESIKTMGFNNAIALSEKIFSDFNKSTYSNTPINSFLLVDKESCDYDKKILTAQGDGIMLFYLGEYQLVF
jgi:hypothetical protein